MTSKSLNPSEKIDPVVRVTNHREWWLASWPRDAGTWYWFERKETVIRPARGPFESQEAARAWFRFNFPDCQLPDEGQSSDAISVAG